MTIIGLGMGLLASILLQMVHKSAIHVSCYGNINWSVRF